VSEVVRRPSRLRATPLEAMPEIGSIAMVPLTAGAERLGVLSLGFADEGPLSTADRGYLTALGGVSALALARDCR
jgi:GAF domain-containing protein